MSADERRPLPATTDPDTAGFWAGTRHQEFRVPRCDHCGRQVWYPRAHCPHCGSFALTWEALPEPVAGTVYTFTVVRRHAQPFYAGRVPYAVAWIDLDGGPRVLSEVAADDVDALRIGDRVEVRWEEHPDRTVPTFVRV